MAVLIAAVDSTIGAALKAELPTADTTSRSGVGTYHLDILEEHTFIADKRYDRLYFTIGVSSKPPLNRINVFRTNAIKAYDFLDWAASDLLEPGAKVGVLTSQWGSIAELSSTRDYPYRMSKAALNMGVAILAQKWPMITWMCLHPGLVTTKMTAGVEYQDKSPLTPKQSATALIRLVEERTEFGFYHVDGRTIPW